MKLPLAQRRAGAGIAAAVAAAATVAACLLALPTTAQAASAAPQLHVSGNRMVDQNGNQVVLHGVNRSGTEYQCVKGNAIFDGPNDQNSINAIKSWGAAINAVRVPMNEACWNGESYVPSADRGANYQNAIKSYVNLLNSNGLVAILDLHWTDGTYTGNSSGCSSSQAVCQKPMPDAAQAIPFWTSVASAFKGDNAVVFDLFNEPYASRATGNSTSGWQCWKNGGSCAGIGYQVAGMQQMVNAVRSTGAGNVMLLGGEEYSNDETGWLQYKPSDPDGNLAASWHEYNFNACASSSCWSSQIAPVVAQVPLVAEEIGENDCSGNFINPLMAWLDSQHTGYLAWTWDNWSGGCSSGPTLITDYNGTPTNFGAAYKAHVSSLPASGGGGTPPPSSPPPTSPPPGGGAELHAVGAGKCLDDPGSTTTPGTQQQIYTCSGAANQLWTYTSSKQLTVSVGGTTLCLDAYGNGTATGTKVDAYTCNGGSNQQWNVNSNGTVTGVQSGLCVDVTNAGTGNGSLVELWTCNGGSNQQWKLG